MIVYFDTNVIVDILLKREPFFENSFGALEKVAEKSVSGIISSSAITDIYYIVNKELKDKEKSLASIFNILKILLLTSTTPQDIFTAKTLDMADFEDAVISVIASRNKADYIITRNAPDFENTLVPAITPTEFLKIHN
ncbi:MAG: PIN domain-containing protein [Fibromonadales bacterium]|nr:PIN domain-containing protein [Fibromonadales bacterium]